MRDILGRIIFVFGAGLLALLTATIIMADVESETVSRLLPADSQIGTMSCPLMMARDETVAFSAEFTNPSDKPLRVRVDADISQGSLSVTRRDDRIVEIAPGETETLVWNVTADDAAYDRVVVGRFFNYQNNVLESAATNCGVAVVDVPFLTGAQTFRAILASGLALLASGIVMLATPWPVAHDKKDMVTAYAALGGTLLLPLIFALSSDAYLAVAAAVIPFLVLVSLLEHSLIGSHGPIAPGRWGT